MYSRKVIEANLDRVEQKRGFRPTPSGYHLVQSRVEHLNSLVGKNGLKRALLSDEQAWILNEQLMCRYDFLYWAERYSRLISHSGEFLRFKANVAQRIILDRWAIAEENSFAISEIDLKARQLGVTTLCELACTHRMQYVPFTRAVIGSSDPQKSFEMSQKVEICLGEQPWWMMPRQTKFERGKCIEFGDMHCFLGIQHGTQKTGIGRGGTPNFAHLSEMADYENPEELIDASILRAMHESPKMFLVLEGTAKRMGGWWYNKWQNAKKHSSDGLTRLSASFLPWFVGTDIYPTEAWLRKRPVPIDWQPQDLTIQHAVRAAKYVDTNPELQKHLGADWTMPVPQMWWWEVTRAEYKEENKLAEFLSELPADDEEAFTNANPSALTIEVISNYREQTRPPEIVYGFEGPEELFPSRYWPSRRERDESKPRLHIRANWDQSDTPFECDLVPVKFHGYAHTPPFNKLFVWEKPTDNEEYGTGVDVSEGSGLDNSVIQVLRKGTIYKPDAFVAEFVSPDMNALDLWPFCMAIGSWYAVKFQGQRKQPRQVIECATNGETTQFELKKRGWTQFHVWVRTDRKRINVAGATRLGWFTNAWSRPMMMDWIVKAVTEGWVDMPSPSLVSELASLEKSPTETRFRMQASYGNNDDRVMAAAMVFFSLHFMGKRGQMHSAAYRRARENEVAVEDPVWTPPMPTRNGSRAMLPEEQQAVLTTIEKIWSQH